MSDPHESRMSPGDDLRRIVTESSEEIFALRQQLAEAMDPEKYFRKADVLTLVQGAKAEGLAAAAAEIARLKAELAASQRAQADHLSAKDTASAVAREWHQTAIELAQGIAALKQDLGWVRALLRERPSDYEARAVEIAALKQRLEEAEKVLQKIDHEVKDNNLSLDDGELSLEHADDLREAHRICDHIAKFIDTLASPKGADE